MLLLVRGEFASSVGGQLEPPPLLEVLDIAVEDPEEKAPLLNVI